MITYTASSNSFTFAGLSPASLTAVSPTPIPKTVRPGASSATVDMLEAVTKGLRITGFVNKGPIIMELVFCAAADNST